MVHPPPTGKHCQNDIRDEPEDTQNQDNVMAVLLDIKQQMGDFRDQMGEMNNRMKAVEDGGQSEQREERNSEVGSDSEEAGSVQADTHDDEASPVSLRKDLRLMRQAAEKLARLRMDDSDDNDMEDLPKTRDNGKKSGATMTAVQSVRTRIDWPHFYVQRMGAGKTKGVICSELKVEEFVFGFLAMLRAAKGKWEKEEMLDLLQNMMQDTMEFSWANALTFYEKLGIDIEKKLTSWASLERIRELRMTYARTVFPQKREVKEGYKGGSLQAAPNNMKCCMAYQKHSCEMDRDHHPFTHACVYCFKARSAICRHPEEDCMRKGSDASKNGKPRES